LQVLCVIFALFHDIFCFCFCDLLANKGSTQNSSFYFCSTLCFPFFALNLFFEIIFYPFFVLRKLKKDMFDSMLLFACVWAVWIFIICLFVCCDIDKLNVMDCGDDQMANSYVLWIWHFIFVLFCVIFLYLLNHSLANFYYIVTTELFHFQPLFLCIVCSQFFCISFLIFGY